MTAGARRATRSTLIVGALLALAGCKGARGGALDAGLADGPIDAPLASSTAPAPDAAPPDDEIPPTTSDDLTSRARHLLEAMGKDDADLAIDIVFPRSGWVALRDVEDPGKEWDKKIDRPFRRAIHVAFRRHLEGAQFVSIDLGHAVIQEAPRHHGWKKGLWTVHGSRLTYVIDGHTRTVSIREMTAWRGAWYVTRLR